MSPALLRSCILMVMMVAGAGLAWALTPHRKLADEQVAIVLDTMVPRQFGEWTELPASSATVVDASRQKMLDKIYADTLSRVYVSARGYPVMLSIAYGRDQSDSLALHQPEICYPAQGFTVLERHPHTLQLAGRPVPAMRMNTQGSRPEPLTYWTVVGQRSYQGGIAKKLAQMRYGLAGEIPDGMLVRISSADPQTAVAYAEQARFAVALADALPAQVRARFVGAPQP